MGVFFAIGWFVAMWLGSMVGRLDLILVGFSATAFAAIWLWRRERLFAWFHYRPRAILLGALIGVFFVVSAHVVYPHLPTALPFVEEGVQSALQSLSTDSAWLTLPAIAFGEEILFRGLVFEDLCERWGKRVAYPASVLLYAGAQSGAGIALLPGLALGFGLLFAWEAHATRGLWAPLVTHLIWTPSVVVFFPISAG